MACDSNGFATQKRDETDSMDMAENSQAIRPKRQREYQAYTNGILAEMCYKETSIAHTS